MNLKIDGIIEGAERIGERVSLELPSHSGLAGAVAEVSRAARHAKRVALEGRRFFSLSRLPATFLALALLGFLTWVYANFFMVSSVNVSVPLLDFRNENLRYFRKAKIATRRAESSKEAIQQVVDGRADVALIQAGIPVPEHLTVLETPMLEIVLWMKRKDLPEGQPVSVVLTNAQGEGSHRVAQDFFRRWNSGRSVEFRHGWNLWTPSGDEPTSIAPLDPDIDAVFVVLNVTDEKNIETINRLVDAGFQIQSPYIGAQTTKLRYIQEFLMPQGYISQNPTIPTSDILTYTVPNLLVARRSISDSTLANLSKLFETETRKLRSSEYVLNAKDASDIFQGMDAFLGILINIILGFVALLGLEMWVYRKRFHELNSLVSLLSMLQSNKDILGETDSDRRSENLQYLSIVSDLLSMISAINGFYTQENSALLFNNQSEVIHQRCDNLKLNIQLKILHAGIRIEPRKTPSEPQGQSSTET